MNELTQTVQLASASAVGSSDLLGVIELWLLWAVECACFLCAVSGCIFVAQSLQDIIREYRREKCQNDRQDNQPYREKSNAAVNPLLVMGQSGYQCGSLRNRLGNPSRTVLVTWVVFRIIQGLLVNIEKLLFYVAVKICGDPLPVFFRRFVIHNDALLTPNDPSSATATTNAAKASKKRKGKK
jgi:hypothetical protein